MPFREHAVRFRVPVQGEIRPKQVEASVGKGQCGKISLHQIEHGTLAQNLANPAWLALRILQRGSLQHRARYIQARYLGVGKLGAERSQALAMAAPQIQGALRRKPDNLHALLHPLSDLPQQESELAERIAAAVEGESRQPRRRQVGIGRIRGMQGHGKISQSRKSEGGESSGGHDIENDEAGERRTAEAQVYALDCKRAGHRTHARRYGTRVLAGAGARLASLADLLLPSACALCGAVQTSPVCLACATDLLSPVCRCRQCAMPGRFAAGVCQGCRVAPPAFAATITLGHYDDQRSQLVLALKHGGRLPLAAWIGRALARRWFEGLDAGDGAQEAGGPDSEGAGSRPDCIVPIPLSPARLAQRGFNQAWQIARALGAQMRVRTSPDGLLRTRDTAVQASLDLPARLPNLAGAFRISPRVDVRGLHIAVVDDVMTTGATLAEAAAVLKRHGARRVTAIAALRTP